MPKYVYKCNECNFEFEVVHSMQEKLKDCDECGTIDALKRIPSFSFTLGKDIEDTKTSGTRVKEFIEGAREELREEQKFLKKKEYNG